jgi:hypothetical protein
VECDTLARQACVAYPVEESTRLLQAQLLEEGDGSAETKQMH